MVSKVRKDGKEFCFACESYDCSCHEVLEEQLFKAARAFLIVEQGNKLPVGVKWEKQYKEPRLYGLFHDHFLETEGSEVIVISSPVDLDEYCMEQDPAHQPVKPDYSSVEAMKRKGISWQEGDYVFMVWSVSHRWQIKGGIYRP